MISDIKRFFWSEFLFEVSYGSYLINLNVEVTFIYFLKWLFEVKFLHTNSNVFLFTIHLLSFLLILSVWSNIVQEEGYIPKKRNMKMQTKNINTLIFCWNSIRNFELNCLELFDTLSYLWYVWNHALVNDILIDNGIVCWNTKLVFSKQCYCGSDLLPSITTVSLEISIIAIVMHSLSFLHLLIVQARSLCPKAGAVIKEGSEPAVFNVTEGDKIAENCKTR